MSVFYNNLEYLCPLKGLSVYSAAERAGVKSSGTVSYWRNDNSIPREGVVKKLADILHTTPYDLVNTDLRLKAAEKNDCSLDPLYLTIMSLSPQNRALVSVFIAGLVSKPLNSSDAF